MDLPRKTRTRAMRLRDELQRASTEELIQGIQAAVENSRAELERVRKRDAEEQDQCRKKRQGKNLREQE